MHTPDTGFPQETGGSARPGRTVSAPRCGVPAAVLLVVLLAGGCAESVDTRLDIDRPFTLWGLLNPKADTQAVRVFEIENTLRLVRPDPLDAVVSTTDLQTGETRVWRDSVLQLRDGDFRHVFWSAFEPQVGHTYHLEVRRSDGATSSAETRVPPPITLEVLEPDIATVRQALLPVFIRGDAPTLPRIDADYRVVSLNREKTVSFDVSVVISYQGVPEKEAGGWLLEIDMLKDFPLIFQELDDRGFPTDAIELQEIELRVHVGDETWVSPIGRFDPDFLVEPGVFGNVVNGFGFFGSGYIESTRWIPPVALIQRAGFRLPGN